MFPHFAMIDMRRFAALAALALSAGAANAQDTTVVVVESPYRTLVNPFVHYLESRRAEDPDEVTSVLLQVYVAAHWWQRILYNQNTNRIRSALVGRKDIVVLDVPYRLEEEPAAA